MKRPLARIAAAALWSLASAAAATTVISVGAANQSLVQDLRLDADSLVAVHWTSSTAYSNVTISAQLSCTPCSGKNDASYADVYLMTQIGPLANSSHQIASTRVRVSGARTMVPLFTGLTLLPNEYYLVIYSPYTSQPGESGPSGPALAWAGTSDANASVAVHPRTTRDAVLIYANNSGSQLINATYPPASFFYRSPTGPEYDLTGAYNLQFQVVSNPPIVLPQFCMGGGWTTSLGLVNLDSSTVTYTLRFWTGDGEPLPVPIAPGGEVTATLAPGATYFAEISSDAPVVRQGWVEILASGRLSASAILRQETAGRASEVSYTGGAPIGSISLLFDNTQSFVTTLAIANPNPSRPLLLTLTATPESGTAQQTSLTLVARGQAAFPLTLLMSQLAGRRGLLQITASSPDFAVVGLRFDGAASTMSAAPVFP